MGAGQEADGGRWFGPYRVVRPLGRGGMGQVFLARDAAGRPAAVKVVHSFLARDPEFRVRFAREVAAAGAVASPCTAALLAADPDAERPWLASAYVEGPTLAALLRAHGPLAEGRLRALAAALATALGAIHAAGIVHRDLKPANVIVGAAGPCVIDFGVARAADATRLTGTGVLMGTAGYAAPEHLTEGVSTPACDVFALGAVLATAATGRRPFGDGPAHAVAYRTVHGEPDLAGVPEGLRELVAGCLAKDPGGRPAVAAVAAEAGPAGGVSWAFAADAVRDRGAGSVPDEATAGAGRGDLPPPDGGAGGAATVRDAAGPGGGSGPPVGRPRHVPASPEAAGPAGVFGPPPGLGGGSRALPGPPATADALRYARRPRRRRVVLAGAVVLAATAVLTAALLRGGDGDDPGGGPPPGADGRGRPAASGSPVTNPAGPGGDRALPAPASPVDGVSLATGEWSVAWDNRPEEPAAGEGVNETRSRGLLGVWLAGDTVVRADEHDVRGYDRDDGDLRWTATPPAEGLVPCAMSPATSGGRGAVAYGTSAEAGEGCDRLAVLDTGTGATVWRTGLRPPKGGDDAVSTTVGIVGERVVVRSYSGLVGYALGDGRPVWLRTPEDGDGCALGDAAAGRTSVAMITFCDGGGDDRRRADQPSTGRMRVAQLNAADGTVRWSTELGAGVTGGNIETVEPVAVRTYLEDSDELPLQVFAPDGTAHAPLAGTQPFGSVLTSNYGETLAPELLGWRDTLVTTYSAGPETRPVFGVAAYDARTGTWRWHRTLPGDALGAVYGVGDDGVLLGSSEKVLGRIPLLRLALADGAADTGGTLPLQIPHVDALLAREDTVIIFDSPTDTEGMALLSAPGA
ncbi:serine/threonine protein kinase [Streptomyces sp. WAC 06738]|uniref:serine/threonine-protein kinase n=1 Tax=Streptomyces sp. WAC 06738 TaxID=2203210 RepID=UPI000F70600F|nr:serine/threonine-protein kinase [Streptomyces sp. WAC 06738]AZM44975.1 serine/threonine protein kinase [Streptomyces sp. WAC 06738]